MQIIGRKQKFSCSKTTDKKRCCAMQASMIKWRQMKVKPLTLQEFARLGGISRSKSLTAARRKAIAKKASLARWRAAK